MRIYTRVSKRCFGSFCNLGDASKNKFQKGLGSKPRLPILKTLEEEVYKDKELMREELEEIGEDHKNGFQTTVSEGDSVDFKRGRGLFDGAGDRLRRPSKNRPLQETPSRSKRPYRQTEFHKFQAIDRAFVKTGEISSRKLAYSGVQVEDQQMPPPLAHNLDRVLFNPGVHFLKDPRSGVFNFSPYLENIMSVKDFDFTKIPQYVPSGQDHRLSSIAKDRGKKYVGSTSSLTGILSHLHRTLSHERKPHIMSLSKLFPGKTKSFTYTQLKPVSVFLRYNDKTGVHSVDSDQSNNEEIIVSVLGHLLEAMLTTPEVEFEKMRKGVDSGKRAPEDQPQNAYHYTECGSFLMRSQLDCVDSRLPGTGVFDLKTRAVCAVRHDMDYAQIHDGSHYMINKLDGKYESFAREWYELIRSTMFKYSLQARIGRMDGIFLAYHNIKQMFGFQYVPLEEIDKIYHTSHLLLDSAKPSTSENEDLSEDLDARMSVCGPLIAEAEFKLSVELMSQIFDKIVASHKTPRQSFNVVFYKSERRLYVLAKPMTEENIKRIQSQQEELELIHSPDFKNTYQFGKDPHTIGQHAALDSQWLPPDVKCYELDLRTFINGKLVQPDEFPSLESPEDDWKIQYKLTDQSYIMAARSYDYVFRNLSTETTRITSIPQLVRLEEEIEERIREEALQKLKPPTKMQQIMRSLSDRGRLQQEQQQQQQSQEKKLWFPKPVDSVNKEHS